MLDEYYDKETKTVRIPFDLNEELKDLPLDTEIIIFEKNHNKFQHSIFNQPVDNLPNRLKCVTLGHSFNQKVDNSPKTLTHLTFGYNFNQEVDNLPSNMEKIKIRRDKQNLIKKIPFGCKVVDESDNEIFI